MKLTEEDHAIRIQQYGEEAVSTFPERWMSFYQDPSPQLEYIFLDAFHAAGIVVSGATQFQKMSTQSQKVFLLIILMITGIRAFITIIPTNSFYHLIV